MTDRDKMMRAICSNPADDLPRLAFADWLVDTADPPDPDYAAFIRAQCEREHVEAIEHTCRPHPDGGADIGETECPACGAHWYADDLRNWEYQLLYVIAERVAVPILHALWPGTSHDVGWDGEVVSAPGGIRNGSVRFRRGFAWEVACTAEEWVRLGPEVAWHPHWSVPCDRCEDQAPDWETNVVECRRCDSTGLLAQPCPVEPQPVEVVTLTTRPREADYGPEPFTRRVGKPGWEHARWPGVAFHLPGD